jgi:hypothetical protein
VTGAVLIVGVSGCMGLEPDGSEIVSGGQADVSIQGGSQMTQERDCRLGSAILDALNLIVGHLFPASQISDGETKGRADVVDGLPEGMSLADRDPLRAPPREAGEPTRSPSYGAGRDLSRHGPDRVQGHVAWCAGLAG